MGSGYSNLHFQLDSSTFQIPDLQSGMTVHQLKKAIYEHTGIYILKQTLTYKNSDLDIATRTLGSYKIKDGDTIVVSEKVSAGILVESRTGTRIANVGYRSDRTVADFKQMIERKTEIPISRQKLFYRETPLKDEYVLSEHNITDGDTLLLEITPRESNLLMVEMHDAHVLEIVYNPDLTVLQLKQAIFNKKNIPIDEQRIFFRELHLEDTKILSAYNILAGDSVRLTKRAKLEMHIYIDAPTDTQTLYDFKPTHLILDIKNKIQEGSNVPVREQRLELGGAELEDARTLSYYKIQDGTKIKLVLKEVTPYIYVKYNEESIKLDLDMGRTVLHLKTILVNQTGVPLEEQNLVFSGKVLANNNNKLSDYNVQKECTIFLMKQRNPEKIQIMIKTRNQKIINLSILPDTKISELKSQITNQIQTPPKKQIIKFAGRELADDKTLSSYNVKNNSCLNVGVKRNIEVGGENSDSYGDAFPENRIHQYSNTVEPQNLVGDLALDRMERSSSDVHEISVLPPPRYNPNATLLNTLPDLPVELNPYLPNPELIRVQPGPRVVESEPPGIEPMPIPVRVIDETIIIKVSMLCSNNFDLQIGKNDTILAVKNKLRESKGFDFNSQKIYFNDFHCEDEKSLIQLGIVDNKEIEVDMLHVWKVRSHKEEIEVNFEVECYARATIAKLKEEIEQKFRISFQQLHLFSNGTELLNENTLLHYRLKPQDPIALLTYVSVKIQFSNGKSFNLSRCEMHKSTGHFIKEQINERNRIPADCLKLMYNGREMVDVQTLDSISYVMDKHIFAEIATEKADQIAIFVRISPEDVQLIHMRTLDTVGKVKNVIELQKGVSNDFCSCVYKGAKLNDEDVLLCHQMKDFAEIELIPTDSKNVLLTLMNGRKSYFSLKLYESVEETIKRIKYQFELPSHHVKLLYGRNRLIYISQSSISNGDTLYLGTETSFLLTVQPTRSRPIMLLVSNEETVLSLKHKIQRKENIPVEIQELVCSGTEMVNSQLIGKYNVVENPVIILRCTKSVHISITITDQCGNKEEFPSVDPYLNVSGLRSLLETNLGSKLSDDCRFVFGNNVLPSKSPLCAYQVGNGACILILDEKKDCLRNKIPPKQQQQQQQQDVSRLFNKTITLDPDPHPKSRTAICPDPMFTEHYMENQPTQGYCSYCNSYQCTCHGSYRPGQMCDVPPTPIYRPQYIPEHVSPSHRASGYGAPRPQYNYANPNTGYNMYEPTQMRFGHPNEKQFTQSNAFPNTPPNNFQSPSDQNAGARRQRTSTDANLDQFSSHDGKKSFPNEPNYPNLSQIPPPGYVQRPTIPQNPILPPQAYPDQPLHPNYSLPPHSYVPPETIDMDVQFGSLHFAEQEKRPYNN